MLMDPSSTQLESDPEKESRERISTITGAYDDVLTANQLLQQKYKAQEESFRRTLQKVQARLVAIKESREAAIESESKKATEKHDAFRYSSVGMPYFKDKDQNTPPDNCDTVIMKQCQMYDHSQTMPVSGWTHGDRTRLLAVLLDMTKEIIQKQLQSEIARFQRIKPKTPNITCKIAQLKKEIAALKHKTVENMGVKINQNFDWEDVAQKLNKRHTSREYKAIWELFFHPRVNKRIWTLEEHQELQRLAAENKHQDWESIAKALNKGRTAYQCFVYFRTNVSYAACGRKWTQEENENLKRIIHFFREGNYIPWGKVATSIKTRTKIQCYNKYLRMVEVRKGRFIAEEDAVIINFVNMYGTDFRKMSGLVTGRSARQLRVRYNLLVKLRVSATWTVEDDRKLLQIMANQDSRANYSTATTHFPGKDRQNIRSRYNTLVKWIKAHPHSDLATAPRRGARRLTNGKLNLERNLVKAVQALRAKLNSELQESSKENNNNKLSRNSSDTFLHDSIMSTISAIEIKKQFSGGDDYNMHKAKVKGSYQMIQMKDISSTPREQSDLLNIKHILILLNAKLADKKKFYNSSAGKGFEAIEDQMPKVEATPVMKSYSRKKVTANNQDENPTIFSPVTGNGTFLLSPNFATVTGCKVILNQLNKYFPKDTNDPNEINVSQVARRNAHVYEKLTQLQERFNTLFAWPFILSNESPDHYSFYAKTLKDSRASAKPFVQRPLPNVPAVTIPPPPPKRLRLKNGNDVGIDADGHNLEDINLEKPFP